MKGSLNEVVQHVQWFGHLVVMMTGSVRSGVCSIPLPTTRGTGACSASAAYKSPDTEIKRDFSAIMAPM